MDQPSCRCHCHVFTMPDTKAPFLPPPTTRVEVRPGSLREGWKRFLSRWARLESGPVTR